MSTPSCIMLTSVPSEAANEPLLLSVPAVLLVRVKNLEWSWLESWFKALSKEGRGNLLMFSHMARKNSLPSPSFLGSNASLCFSMPVRNHVTGSMNAS